MTTGSKRPAIFSGPRAAAAWRGLPMQCPAPSWRVCSAYPDSGQPGGPAHARPRGCAVDVRAVAPGADGAGKLQPYTVRSPLQSTTDVNTYIVRPILAAVALMSAISAAHAAPTVEEYRAQFAAALQSHDHTKPADGVFQPIIDSSNKADYQTQLNLGIALLSYKHYAGALAVLGPAARLNPKDPVVHGYLAPAARWSGQRDQSIAEYRLALEYGKGVHPDTITWATALGWQLLAAKQFDEAAKVCSTAGPSSPPAHPSLVTKRLGCLVFAHAGAGHPGPALQAIEALKGMPDASLIVPDADSLNEAGTEGKKLLVEHFPGYRQPAPFTVRGSWPTRTPAGLTR